MKISYYEDDRREKRCLEDNKNEPVEVMEVGQTKMVVNAEWVDSFPSSLYYLYGQNDSLLLRVGCKLKIVGFINDGKNDKVGFEIIEMHEQWYTTRNAGKVFFLTFERALKLINAIKPDPDMFSTNVKIGQLYSMHKHGTSYIRRGKLQSYATDKEHDIKVHPECIVSTVGSVILGRKEYVVLQMVEPYYDTKEPIEIGRQFMIPLKSFRGVECEVEPKPEGYVRPKTILDKNREAMSHYPEEDDFVRTGNPNSDFAIACMGIQRRADERLKKDEPEIYEMRQEYRKNPEKYKRPIKSSGASPARSARTNLATRPITENPGLIAGALGLVGLGFLAGGE